MYSRFMDNKFSVGAYIITVRGEQVKITDSMRPRFGRRGRYQVIEVEHTTGRREWLSAEATTAARLEAYGSK